MVNMMKSYLECTKQNARKAMKLLALCQFNFADTRSENNSSAEDRGSQHKRHGNDEDDDHHIATDLHPAQDEACAPFFFNNMGIIHVMMHKPRLAAYYFQRALKSMTPSSAPMAEVGKGLPGTLATRHWLDRRAEVAYNMGLQLLMCEQPNSAYKCFEQCAPVFRTWPRLWLRMAECCIEMHRNSTTSSA